MDKAAPPPYVGQQPPPVQPVFVAPQQVPMATVSHVTVVPTVTVSSNPPMGAQSQFITCRSCQAQVNTSIRHKATTKTHLFALCLCILGLWPCVCIPYCMDSCQSADHYCPSCNAYIGSYAG